MGSSYNLNLPSTYIQYLDLNNLYGWAMCQPLPAGGFTWLVKDIENWDRQKIHTLSSHSTEGYLPEVYVDYPNHLMVYTMIHHFYPK